MPELVPAVLGWIDAQKQAALAKLAQALSDPGQLLRPSLEAFAEKPEEKIARLVGSAESVMPEVARPAASQLAEAAGQEMVVPGTPAQTIAWHKAIKAGMPPEQIWRELGTFKVPGGFIGKEVSDAKATISEAAWNKIQDELQYLPQSFVSGKVGDVLEHPELFRQFPALANTPLTVSRGPYAGAFSPSWWGMSAQTYEDPEALRSTLLHEVQHEIQSRAGWPVGANVGMIRDDPALSAKFQRIVKGYEAASPTQEAQDALWWIKQAEGEPRDMAAVVYRHHAGEAQARATEARRYLVPANLEAAGSPTSTYDVPLKSLIYKYNLPPVGWKASFAPVSALSALAAALAQQNGQAE